MMVCTILPFKVMTTGNCRYFVFPSEIFEFVAGVCIWGDVYLLLLLL